LVKQKQRPGSSGRGLRREPDNHFSAQDDNGFAVPLYPQVRPLLKRLCAGKAHSDRLLKIADAKKALAGACRRLGYRPFSQRSLRRMFITHAIEKGIDVKVIAEWQGHEDGGKLMSEVELGLISLRPKHRS